MQIKHSEGQTLLTLVRLCIVAAACLCLGPVQQWAQWTFDAASGAGATVGEILEDGSEPVSSLGQPTVLYYSENDEYGSQTHIYQVFYLTGSEGAYGLVNAADQRLLNEEYQGVVLLPHAYVLEQNDQWRFYDRTTVEPLTDESWDEVAVLRSENGRFASDLLSVGRDGLYGAVNMRGQVVIEPTYEYFQLSSLQAGWPLIRVRQEGRYGFIDSSGSVVVSLSYDYAALDSVTVYPDEENAEGVETPIIYVLKDEDWGAIYRNEDGSSSQVDWNVDPTSEVAAAYRQEI